MKYYFTRSHQILPTWIDLPIWSYFGQGHYLIFLFLSFEELPLKLIIITAHPSFLLSGYAFLLFQDESSVQALIDACIEEDGKLYLCVSSPTIKDKPVSVVQPASTSKYPLYLKPTNRWPIYKQKQKKAVAALSFSSSCYSLLFVHSCSEFGVLGFRDHTWQCSVIYF